MGKDRSLLAVVDEFLLTPAWQRVSWAFLCAASWTALEVARGRVLGGFPWNFLAVSQYRLTPVTQMASATGVYGVTFLMVWFSVALLASMLGLARRPSTQRIWSDVALPLLAVTWVTGYGMTKLSRGSSSERTIKVAMVQPSIPQTLVFDPKEDETRFQQLISLSDQALAEKPADLLLWPESAVPDLSPENQQAIGQFLARHHVWLILCADLTERRDSGGNALFNSGVLISPDGEARAIYHKRRLVIFGEYVPLEKWLPFLKWFTPVMEGYTPGEQPVAFKLSHPDAMTSVLICFEDMFPEEGREHAAPDIDFLINLTNDGWFGEGPEQRQQAASAVFRAVENGMPLVRCANNGLTCWVDAQGRLRQIQEQGGSIYGRGFMTVTIPLPGPGEHRQTIYNRYGDWFGWSCCGLSFATLIWRWRNPSVSSGVEDSV
jgi:apolipoprotein N-acyltransferase